MRTWKKNNKTVKLRKSDLRTLDQSERRLIKSTKGAMNKMLQMTEAMAAIELKKLEQKDLHKVTKMLMKKGRQTTNGVLRMRTQMKRKPNRLEQYLLTE